MIAPGVGKKKKNKAKWILSELRAVGTTRSRRTTTEAEGYQKKDEVEEARTRGERARRRKDKKRNGEGAGRVRGGKREKWRRRRRKRTVRATFVTKR